MKPQNGDKPPDYLPLAHEDELEMVRVQNAIAQERERVANSNSEIESLKKLLTLHAERLDNAKAMLGLLNQELARIQTKVGATEPGDLVTKAGRFFVIKKEPAAVEPAVTKAAP